MSIKETDSVQMIPGVGMAASAHFARLHIHTIGNLLAWYPRSYLDASTPVSIQAAGWGKTVALYLTVIKHHSRHSKARGTPMLEVTMQDEFSQEILVRWFHQSFLAQKLVIGSSWIVIGEVRRFQGEVIMVSPQLETKPKILPLYPLVKGLTQRIFRNAIEWSLQHIEWDEELLPEEIRESEHLLDKKTTLEAIHTPQSLTEIESARHRIAFEEVFWFFVQLREGSQVLKSEEGIRIPLDLPFLQKTVQQLPFTLTNSQRYVTWQMVQELDSGQIMTRLLNGDVGSGKTVVAGILATVVAKANYQTVLLAPTELLAQQHAETLRNLFTSSGLRVALWTGSQKEEFAEADCIVGTHAVLQEKVTISRLALAVIDEQHRFGVQQRHFLRTQSERIPHLLSMTATPIPRTLALVLYGDLSVSILNEKPKDRLPVQTVLIRTTAEREHMYALMKKEIEQQHGVMVICPLIEAKKTEDPEMPVTTLFVDAVDGSQERKAVLGEVERLKREYPFLGVIEAIHGKMKPAQKRDIMDRFKNMKINVLVATSLIEVGVDIPHATIMVIEGAERFGLAQLHQFRGRVGRNALPSYCFLCPALTSAPIIERLQVLVENESGFTVAEEDLRLRGPGELSGQMQSGLPDFRMATYTDLDFLHHIRMVADEFLRKNPNYKTLLSQEVYSPVIGGLE